MNKATRIICLVILFLMLIAVRAFVEPFFYDPLIEYFKRDYLYTAIPELNSGLFFLNVFYRYTINAVISLTIIYLIFNNLKGLKFSIKFYLLAFVVLSLVFFILLKFNLNQGYRFIFYVRRFLIHPLFLLILVPAFYYQKLKLEK